MESEPATGLPADVVGHAKVYRCTRLWSGRFTRARIRSDLEKSGRGARNKMAVAFTRWRSGQAMTRLCSYSYLCSCLCPYSRNCLEHECDYEIGRASCRERV